MTTSSSDEDFPLICEICLGDNPFVRMLKLPFGSKLCKATGLQFQPFRWKAGQGRFKETIISSTAAKERNICQACLNDLQFGLPIGVRNALLQQKSQLDISNTSHSTLLSSNVRVIQKLESFAFTKHKPSATSGKSEKDKVAFRNLPRLCTFWINNSCNRVLRNTCPYRPCCGTFQFPELAGSNKEIHDQLVDQLTKNGPTYVMKHLERDIRQALKLSQTGSSQDSIKKRLSGNDELTKKYLNQMNSMENLIAPDNTSTTLWLGNVNDDICESDIMSSVLEAGQAVHVHISRSSKCAFVKFIDRQTAESAVKFLVNCLVIKGHKIQVNWAKTKDSSSMNSLEELLALPPPGMITFPSVASDSRKRSQPSSLTYLHDPPAKAVYGSMDKSRLGTQI